MAKKQITASGAKKVLMIHGNIYEIGQLLTNIYGENPDLVVYEKYEATGIRQMPQSAIALAAPQPQYEPIVVIYLVYTNPGDLKGITMAENSPVKANIKSMQTDKNVN